uniref:Uncharacterized protein n=1 Tax=Anguilla anguilla TaxID=7936 RepID=A0A0E9SCR5_ANGAN
MYDIKNTIRLCSVIFNLCFLAKRICLASISACQ